MFEFVLRVCAQLWVGDLPCQKIFEQLLSAARVANCAQHLGAQEAEAEDFDVERTKELGGDHDGSVDMHERLAATTEGSLAFAVIRSERATVA